MTRKKIVLILGGTAAGALVFGFLTFVAASIWIGSAVQKNCRVAVEKYGGECVDALVSEFTDPSQTYTERNDAIWALGQLGDEKALSVLQAYYTGEMEKTAYSEEISQYELSKAIQLLESGFNPTHWFRF